MPRLLHVLSHLNYDGASTQVRLLAEAAAARGETVAVASLQRPGPVGNALRKQGVPVTWLKQRFAVDPFAARNLRRLVADWQPEVVQSWDPTAAAFCCQSRVPWIHTVRQSEPLPKRIRSAAGLMAADEALAEEARAAGIDAAIVSIVPNAFDPKIRPRDANSKRAARQRLCAEGIEMEDSTPIVVCVARLDDAVRIKEIAWASDLVQIVCPGLRLLIVGDGPDRMACERFAAAAVAPGTVAWLGVRDDLATCLAAADVVWCPSATGTAPTPAIEAMAAGKPLVLADGPGRAQLLPDPANEDWPNCRVRWSDRAAWARVTKRLLVEASLAEQVGQTNAELVRPRHDLHHTAEAHAVAVDQALAGVDRSKAGSKRNRLASDR